MQPFALQWSGSGAVVNQGGALPTITIKPIIVASAWSDKTVRLERDHILAIILDGLNESCGIIETQHVVRAHGRKLVGLARIEN
ncbi:hypothetical protein SDC9_194396 [bioreactor metagenome]|uniref:Uncharacterized protein n=1 Tax=bioreactor metagenome TaxID=1076179 RepID=A0A645I648_9ZZZZ